MGDFNVGVIDAGVFQRLAGKPIGRAQFVQLNLNGRAGGLAQIAAHNFSYGLEAIETLFIERIQVELERFGLDQPGAFLRNNEAGQGHQWLAFQVRSEEHTSELQSLMRISYAVFCLKKKKKQNILEPNLNI